MPIAPANGIEICYESFGSPSDPALVLIRAFGAWPQLIDAIVGVTRRAHART